MEQAAGIARKANSPLLVYYHPRASLLLSNGPWSQSADSDNRHDKALREKAEASGCVVSVATQGD